MRRPSFLTFTLLWCAMTAQAPAAETAKPFYVQVIDSATNRGVPLVELRTTNEIAYFTDSQGIAVIAEPGLDGLEVFLHVQSHGYEFPKDGFGTVGKKVRVQTGEHAVLKVERLNIAERLYRVTGGGIYRDSVLAGLDAPIQRPLLNAQVFGSDSVLTAEYDGRLFWFWGDTKWPAYPLGNFQTTGATSRLPTDGGLSPDVGVNLEYFAGPDGFARGMAKMEGECPTWIDGLVVLPDSSGTPRMLAAYAKVRGMLDVYRRGFCRWDDERQEFVHAANIDPNSPVWPSGHSFKHADSGVEYIYFADPFPLTRVRATAEAYLDLCQYESFTCAAPGEPIERAKLERDEDGRLRYQWRRGAAYVDGLRERDPAKRGLLKPGEGRFTLRDVESGQSVVAHRGSVYFNRFRQRWAMIATQSFGTSLLGEIWYAEADEPLGPWRYATKIVTHNRYSFYNPKQHPQFAQGGDRVIYFEGTYTTLFTDNQRPTPRYDYNQLMYRLNLDDPRLMLPVAVYADEPRRSATFRLRTSNTTASEVGQPAFFACDRPRPGTIPMFPGADGKPLFHALPADTENPPAHTAPLYEWRSAADERIFTMDADWKTEGYSRAEKPLCRVWKP